MKNISRCVFKLVLVSLLGASYCYAENDDTQNAQQSMQKSMQSQEGDTSSQKPQAGKPPQAAISSCENKPASSQCSFQGPRTSENGTCEYTPDKQYFACKPSRNNG